METKSYTTKQKNQIKELLVENSDHHLTVDDMMNILYQKNIQVSRATLYRYLDFLVSTGCVRKMYTGDDKSCYQYISDSSKCMEHFHLMCTSCGKLIHLECEELQKIMKHISSEHHFVVNTSKIVLYGICKNCLEEGNNKLC